MPPDVMIWDGTSDEIDEWIDNVMKNKVERSVIRIDPSEIE
jgi:hypothetical protein